MLNELRIEFRFLFALPAGATFRGIRFVQLTFDGGELLGQRRCRHVELLGTILIQAEADPTQSWT